LNADRTVFVPEPPATSGRILVLELLASGQAELVWRINLGAAQGLLAALDSVDKSQRKCSVDQADKAILAEPVPYYILADDDLIALSAVLR